MRRRSAAALARFAAICGLLVVPSAVEAQLRCSDNPAADTLIRNVAFEGNSTFGDNELALHIVSTETDLTRKFLDKKKAVWGTTGLFVLTGAAIKGDASDRLKRALGLGLVGFFVGQGVSRISGTPRCMHPGTFAGDIGLLSSFYRDEGFIDVRVDTTTKYDGNWVDVTFRVTEGQPVLVDSLAIIGFDTTTMGPLPTSLNSRKGGRYSPTLTQEDVDSLQTRLYDNGYPEAHVERTSTRLSNYRYRVEFNVTAGTRARIGKIIVSDTALQGRHPKIDEGVIRSMLRFESGDLYSQRVLFEAGRRFYQVGTFVSAEVAPDISHVGADSLVDVRVNLVEDLSISSTLERALGTLDCFRLRGSYSDKAFLHGLNRLDVNASVSKVGLARGTKWRPLNQACVGATQFFTQADYDTTEVSSRELNYNATVRLSRPMPLPGGLLPSVSAYTERRGGYNAYLRTTLIGGAVTVSKAITRTIGFEGSYNLEFGHTEASETVLCFLFRACDQSARNQLTQGDKRLAVVGARFSRDRRNSPDSASAGSFVRLDLRSSSHFFLSDTTLEFRKGVIDAAWYRRIGSGVLVLRARAGSVAGGQQTGGAQLPPPQERLYVGGETSVRGFHQNQLGPLIYVTSDDTIRAARALNAPDAERSDSLQALTMRIIPAGGNKMAIGNLEYRIPGPFVHTLQTILFLDAGALSTKGITILRGSNQFRFTPGVAIKYFSPVGPVQVNVGYNHYNLEQGPAYSDQFRDASGQPFLKCISGEVNSECQPLTAIKPLPKVFIRRLVLSVAFPPDF